ncbi:UNVERIFIED_CONTAM: succinate--hydroxymethylglutarate CoA-transferase [Brevibacillus sp. OAP136]
MLSGITILDFTMNMPGPYCSMRLADLGATVIKVETLPLGDPQRAQPPLINGTGAGFLALNRNKKSIALNLRAKEGKELAFGLARQADVVLESYRPGVMKLLGLDYHAIRRVNPAIVYGSITGYGQRGPLSQAGVHDLNVQAQSGMLANDLENHRPLLPRVPVSDYATGIYAAEQVCAALVQKERQGIGAFLDIAAIDVVASWMGQHAMLIAEGRGREAEKLGQKQLMYGMYETADARFVAFAAVEEKFWVNFCHAVGREDWEALSHLDAWSVAELQEEVRSLFLTRTQSEWHELGLEVDCCLTAVEEMDTLLDNPFWHGRELLSAQEKGEWANILQVRTTMHETNEHFSPPPTLGANTFDILRERLHMTDRQLRAYEAVGLIGGALD